MYVVRVGLPNRDTKSHGRTTLTRLQRALPDERAGLSATARHFASGALASMLTDACTFPFDTLKKNLQAASVAGRGGAAAVTARGVAAALFADGGVARFYHGYGVRLLIVGLKGAVDNYAFVRCKELLQPVMG